MRVVRFSEVRSNLKQVIDEGGDDRHVIVISRYGAPDAVRMSLETYNNWCETAHLLGTPADAAYLAKSLKQLRGGKARESGLTDASAISFNDGLARTGRAASRSAKPPAPEMPPAAGRR